MKTVTQIVTIKMSKLKDYRRLKDYRKVFAWTSIYLIISLTFITANALAFNYRVSGEDLVNNWRKTDDLTLFFVNASANVSLLVGEDWTPMICAAQGNTSVTCEYFVDRNTVTANTNNVTWRLRHEIATPIEYVATVKVDKLLPRIERVNTTKIGTALKVSYSVRDLAYPGSTTCSGLDYVSYVVGSLADTISFNTTLCQYNGTVIFNESGFYQEDFTISITVKDRLNPPVTNTTTMILDLMGPDIQDEWQLMRNGQILEVLSNTVEGVQADVVIYIDDPKLDLNKVRGDLSGLHTNPQLKNSLRNKQATCVKESDNLYKCTFFAIPIKPANENLEIKVNAYDTSGNFANETLTKTITLLNDAGQIKYIGPLKEHCTSDLSSCYTKKGGQNFVLEIGAGSNYSLLGIGFNNAPALALCTFEEEQWICRAPYSVPDGITQLKMHTTESSRDTYGNKLPYVERNIIVDNQAPNITSNITSNLPNCAVSSDTLELTFTAKESTSEILKAYVNTTGITAQEMTNGTCEKTVNDEWLCALSITGFVSELTPTMRKVTVEDLAGNTAYRDFKFEVCAEDSNAVPNIITKITPDDDITTDRRTASLLPVKTYVPLTITKSTSGTIIEMTVDNCKAYDDSDEEISVLDSGHYFIDDTLVLYVGFDGAQLPDEEFDINCTVNSRVRVGNKVYLKPEQDSFIITAKPYNNPLGVLDSSVNTKIADQKAALRDLDKEIELRKTIGGVFETICNLAQIIVKINNILQLLKSVIYAVCVTMVATGILSSVAESIWEFVGTTLNSIDITVQTYVWPTNILSGSTYGQVIKYTCLLYTCQHYKVSGLIEIGTAITDLIGSAEDQKEKAKATVDKEKKKQEDQVNQQKYQGTKIAYEKDGKNYIAYMDSKGNFIEGSEKLATGTDTVGATMMQYSEVQKLNKVVVNNNIIGSDIGKDCNGMLCNDEKSVFFPEGDTEKNPESVVASVEEKNGVVLSDDLVTDGSVGYTSTVPEVVVVDEKSKPLVFIGGKKFEDPDSGETFWNNVYYTEEDGKIVYYEKIYGIPNAAPIKLSADDFNKYYGQGLYSYDTRNVANMLWSTKQEGWLGNTHAGGLTYDLEGEIVNGKYVINAKKNTAVVYSGFSSGFEGSKYVINSRYYDDLSFSSVNELSNFLKKEKNSKVTLVTRKSYNVKIFTSGTNSGGNNGAGGVITDITGRAGGAGGATGDDGGFSMSVDEMWGDVDDANQQYYERNLKFYTALEAEDWIINPYRSAHWDGLCAPAVVYNLQKERQIRCKYLQCMETQLVAGMPSYICDRDYGMEACLYIDSAQWHVTGGGFWDNIGAGLLKSFLSTLIGLALYTGYSAACSNYLGGMGQGGTVYGGGGASQAQPAGKTTLATGWWDVSCGLLGTALQWKEITALGSGDFWSSFFESDIPKDPSEIKDYCADVNYNE